MSESKLNADFNEANKLVRAVYPVDFLTPKVEVMGYEEYLNKFVGSNIKRGFMRSIPFMIYNSTENTIFPICPFVFENRKNEWSLNSSLIPTFAHEIGHAMQSQLNIELSEHNLTDKINNWGESREEGLTLASFCEGIADLISFNACIQSLDNAVSQIVINQRKDEILSFEGYKNEKIKDFYMEYGEKYRLSPNDWPRLVAAFHKENEGITLQENIHFFGNNFARNNQEKDVLKMIMHPPRTYEELSIPSKYNID